MKNLLLGAVAAIALLSVPAFSQTYPTNNPTYIPTAVAAPTTLTTTGDVEFNLNGINALSVRLTGTHSVLTAALQVTNERTASPNWSTVYAVPVSTPSGAAVNSFTANGFWVANVAGMVKARVHVTALTGTSVTVAMAGANATNMTTLFNPQAVTGPVGIVDGAGGVNLLTVGSDNAALVKGVAGTAIMGKVGIDQTTVGTTNGVAVVASAAGGGTPGYLLSAASNNATSIKAGAGTLYWIGGLSTNATTAYLKLYDTVGAPTCASDTVVAIVPIIQNVPFRYDPPLGVNFGTGIGMCIVALAAANDNTSATTGINVSYVYK